MFLGAYEMAGYTTQQETKGSGALIAFLVNLDIGILQKLLIIGLTFLLCWLIWPEDSFEIQEFNRKQAAQRLEDCLM
jgi:hypothetical protein